MNYSLINILICFLLIYTLINGCMAQKNNLPEDFEQILPRGRIAAINNPTFVTADKANIKDNSWVLAVIINNQARAYSLNLLNSHEVVNDKIDSTKFAAVW